MEAEAGTRLPWTSEEEGEDREGKACGGVLASEQGKSKTIEDLLNYSAGLPW